MITLTLVTDGRTIDIDPHNIQSITRHPGALTGCVVTVHDKFVDGPYGYPVAEDLLTICTLIALDRAGQPDTIAPEAYEAIAECDAADIQFGTLTALAECLRMIIHPDGTIVIER